MKLFKSNDCEGFCLYTDFYGGAIKRSSNCQTSVQFLPSNSYLNLPLSYASFGCNYVAYALPHRCDESVQIFFGNLVPLLPNCLLHLLLRTRLIATLGNSLLYYLPKSLNWVEIRAIWGPIKYSDLVSRKSSYGGSSFVCRRAVHLYDRWGRIELGGVNIHIILPVVVFVEVLQAWVDVILEALSRNIAPFLLVPKDQRPFLNTRKASPNHCMRCITKSWPKAVRVKSFVRPSSYEDALVTATVHCRFVCPYNLKPVFDRPRAYLVGECESLLTLPLGEPWLWVSDASLEAFLS